ncbi:uncharacterized protein evi2b [Pholidichthys leucotaenia]
MATKLLRLILLWLLPWTGSSAVTSAQNHSFIEEKLTTVTTETSTEDQLMTQEMTNSHLLARVSPSTTTVEETSTNLSTLLSSRTILPTKQTTAASPTSFTLPQSNSSTGKTTTTELQSVVDTSSTTVTTPSSMPTTPRSVPSMPSTYTTQIHEETSTFQPTTAQSIHPQITAITDATVTFTKLGEGASKSTTSGPRGRVTQHTGSHTLSTAISTTTKRLYPSGKKDNSRKGASEGKIVAGIIGGAFALMVVGFLVIYIKKRKLHQQQVTSTEWAGPTPFLESGGDNGQVTLRSSNRISLASFLPQTLSKRLSLLPEADEELLEMTPTTTFGGKTHGSTFGQETDQGGMVKSNGTAGAVPEIKNEGAANSVNSVEQNNNDNQTSDNVSEVKTQSHDPSANQSDHSGAADVTTAQTDPESGQS